MYNLAIRKCVSPPLLAPRLKIFKMKIYYPAGDRTPDLLEPEADKHHIVKKYNFKSTNWLLRNPEVHYRPYISSALVPIFSKIFSILLDHNPPP